MRSLIRDFTDSLRNPEFWLYSTWLDIVTEYRRTKLGLVWVAAPAVAYTFGVGYIYGGMFSNGGNYFIHLGMGYALWAMTSHVLNGASRAFTAHKSFIMDGHIRYTDFVLRTLARSVFTFMFAFIPVFVLLVIDPSIHWLNMLTLLGTVPVYLFNLVWIGIVLAIVGARFSDLREFIGTLLAFGFVLSPILWRASDLPVGTLRGTLARLNPAFHFIEFTRAPVMGQPVEFSSYVVVAGMSVGGLVVAALAYRRYSRYIPLWA